MKKFLGRLALTSMVTLILSPQVLILAQEPSTCCNCCQNTNVNPIPFSLENGGTNATEAEGARTNLNIYSKSEVDGAISDAVGTYDTEIRTYVDEAINPKLIPMPTPPDPNDITLKTGCYIPANVNLPRNDSTGVIENKVMYNSNGSMFCILQYWYRYRENEVWKRTYNTTIGSTSINAWTQWIDMSPYPVGSIYLSVSPTNPGTIFGGYVVCVGTRPCTIRHG